MAEQLSDEQILEFEAFTLIDNNGDEIKPEYIQSSSNNKRMVIDEEKDEIQHNTNNEPKKSCANFISPNLMLETRIEKAKKLKDQMYGTKEAILCELKSLKGKIRSIEYADERYGGCMWMWRRRPVKWVYSSDRDITEYIGRLKHQIENQWPQDSDSDVEPEVNEESQKLRYRLNHGSRNLAEERQICKGLKEMEGRKERRKAKTNPAKQDLQDRISECLKELDDRRIGREFVSFRFNKQNEQKKAEINKEIVRLEKREAEINAKITRIQEYIVVAQELLNEQELGARKELVAREELSYKQVEGFMCQWKGRIIYSTPKQRWTKILARAVPSPPLRW